MDNLITYFWQSNMCLLVFFLGYILWLKNEPSFNYRRLYIIVASLLSIVIPLLKFPSVSRTYLTALNLPSFSLTEVIVSTPIRNDHWLELLLATYLIISLLLLTLSLYRILQTLAQIRKCTKSETQHHGHYIYNTNGQLPSSSYYNYLLYDNTHPIDHHQRQLILDHEIVHINQGHSYDLLFLEFIKVVFWINPMVWLMQRELRQVHEYIADNRVVNDHNRQQYLEILAQRTLYQFHIPWVQHFNLKKNLTLSRIAMIQSRPNPTRLWKYGIFLGLYALLHVAVACTDEQPINDNQPEDIYSMVDERPFPVNGMEAFYQELGSVLKYPEQARRMGIEGKVYVSFVVQKSGELTDITVLKGIGAGCDEAALAAMNKVSSWTPGMHQGKAVPVLMQIPIVFKLSDS